MEIWKDIPGYEGIYQASNLGRAKGLARTIETRPGVFAKSKQKILVPYNGKSGDFYTTYNFSKNGKATKTLMHRIVASLFVPNPENYPCINHKDGDKTNCKATNLEWCTHSQNTRHAYKNGLMGFMLNAGEKNGRSKLTTEEVMTMREIYDNFMGEFSPSDLHDDLAEVFEVHRTSVIRIVKRTHWKIERRVKK